MALHSLKLLKLLELLKLLNLLQSLKFVLKIGMTIGCEAQAMEAHVFKAEFSDPPPFQPKLAPYNYHMTEKRVRSHSPLTCFPRFSLDLRYNCGHPHNKDSNVLGSISGSSYFGELPLGLCMRRPFSVTAACLGVYDASGVRRWFPNTGGPFCGPLHVDELTLG